MKIALGLVHQFLGVRYDTYTCPILQVVLHPVTGRSEGIGLRYVPTRPHFYKQAAGYVTGRAGKCVRTVLRRLPRVMYRDEGVDDANQHAGLPLTVFVVLWVI